VNQSPIEPSADQRTGAKQLRGMFLALVAEGFTEQQALAIIGQAMVANAMGGEK
jgi:hypothetical protein